MSDSTEAVTMSARAGMLSSQSLTTIAACAIVICGLGFHLFAPLGPDVSWLLTVAERMLDGQVLYVDILEPNPPMAGLLYILPVGLARVLGMHAEPLVALATVLFGTATSLLTARAIKAAGLATRADMFLLLALLLAVVAWGEDFAQREHFATMAALPMMAAIAARAAGHRLRLGLWLPIGLCGGLVLAIKPHFAVAILLPVLFAAWRRRSMAPAFAAELWVAGLVVAGFVMMTWLWFPGFFGTILPAANTVYVPDRRALATLLFGVPSMLVFEATLAIAVIVFWRPIAERPLSAVLMLASLGFAIVYFVQGKGFPYHVAPAQVMLSLALLGALGERGVAARSRSDLMLFVAAALALAALPTLNAIKVRQFWEAQAQVLRPYGEGLSIANLTTDLAATSPLHRLVNGTLVNSAPSLLMTLSAYRVRAAYAPTGEWLAAIEAVEGSERDRLKADFLKYQPDILVVSDLSLAWLNWATEDAELAPLMAQYGDIAEVEFVGGPLRLLARDGLEPKGSD